MLKIILPFFVLAITHSTFTQITQQWIKTNPSVSYCSYLVMSDDSGNVYSAGGVPDNNTDFLLIKYDSNGNQKWLRTYNGPSGGIDFIKCITKDRNGYIYVSGESEKENGDEEYCTQKYNSAGTLIWTSRFNSFYNFENKPTAIGVDANGNVYITGKCSVLDQHPRKYQYLTVKYNTNGVLLWSQYFGSTSGNDEAVAIAVDSLGYCIVTGRCNCSGPIFGIMTIKYNIDGGTIWQAEIPAGEFSEREPFCLKTDTKNNIYIAGITEDSASGYNYRFLTAKYSPAGIELWEKIYHSTGNTSVFPSALLVDNNFNVYVAGTEQASTLNAVAVKYDSSGNMLWENIYNSGNDENISDAAFDSTGNIVFAGAINSSTGNNDVFLRCLNPAGTQIFTYRYQTTGNDFGASISIDKNDNLFIAGYDSSADYNFITVKFKIDDRVGAAYNHNDIPVLYGLSQNYPNPFNPKTIINYQLPISSDVKLLVYDISGKEIETLVNQKQSAGSYKVEWDGSKYSSGVYFYRIETSSFTQVKKMILIK